MYNTFAIDFLTVPSATFKILYVCVIIHHESRKAIHFNVTEHPSAQWTAQQIVEACPWASAPKYLLRDRDGIYGKVFQNRVQSDQIVFYMLKLGQLLVCAHQALQSLSMYLTFSK